MNLVSYLIILSWKPHAIYFPGFAWPKQCEEIFEMVEKTSNHQYWGFKNKDGSSQPWIGGGPNWRKVLLCIQQCDSTRLQLSSSLLLNKTTHASSTVEEKNYFLAQR